MVIQATGMNKNMQELWKCVEWFKPKTEPEQWQLSENGGEAQASKEN